MIRLHAVVIRSRSEDPKPDPVVFLAGGPGASALAAVSHVQGILSAILWERDLVVADQRGVGFSEPALDCPEYGEVVRETYGAGVSPEEAQARMFDALTICRDRLMGEGVNLAAYTSATSATDVHDLMQAESFVFPGYTHDVLSSSTCARQIMKQFLDAPQGTPDSSCLE
jgi:pimeloyl-ACP methyl ester carboxylesterase